jgi:hypothetical protein
MAGKLDDRSRARIAEVVGLGLAQAEAAEAAAAPVHATEPATPPHRQPKLPIVGSPSTDDRSRAIVIRARFGHIRRPLRMVARARAKRLFYPRHESDLDGVNRRGAARFWPVLNRYGSAGALSGALRTAQPERRLLREMRRVGRGRSGLRSPGDEAEVEAATSRVEHRPTSALAVRVREGR